MHKFSEKKIFPYRSDQVFNLIADVGKYPEFLPWCVGARLKNQTEAGFDADVLIGFKLFRERFTSRVRLDPNRGVDVDYIKGPMKRLYNHWRFEDQPDGSCLVDFEVDFEFKSKMLEEMIGPLFEKACHKMMAAFESRAADLYSKNND
jgi:coenzyme Q-binding protein COQ10